MESNVFRRRTFEILCVKVRRQETLRTRDWYAEVRGAGLGRDVFHHRTVHGGEAYDLDTCKHENKGERYAFDGHAASDFFLNYDEEDQTMLESLRKLYGVCCSLERIFGLGLANFLFSEVEQFGSFRDWKHSHGQSDTLSFCVSKVNLPNLPTFSRERLFLTPG